nr:VOC family protein [uncultured Roseateles sp.]
MSFALSAVGQVSLTVDDVDTAEAFYTATLGLRKLYRFGELLFLDMAGLRLYIEKARSLPFVPASSMLYFRVPDIALAHAALTERGVSFQQGPQRVAPMPDHDLWLAFFKDPAGNPLALMCEAPKGWAPGA